MKNETHFHLEQKGFEKGDKEKKEVKFVSDSLFCLSLFLHDIPFLNMGKSLSLELLHIIIFYYSDIILFT